MELVFSSNLSTEAIECTIKIAKMYHFYGTKSKRRNYCHEEVFSCKSMGALSITGKVAYQEPFGPCFLILSLPILMTLKVLND